MAKKAFGEPIDRMTAYCTYCPKMCRFSCPAAEAENRETVTPWAMMRLFELVKGGAVEPSEEIAEIFHHCLGCKRCQTWCRHDNDVPQAMWEARDWMADLGYVPEALKGFREDFLAARSPYGPMPGLKDDESSFDPTATVVYMPDCQTRRDNPALVARTGRLLEILYGSKVRLHSSGQGDDGRDYACCGFPLLSAGHKDDYEVYRGGFEGALGEVDFVITECASMAALYREGNSWGTRGDLDVVHLIEFLAERIEFLPPPNPLDPTGIMLHDSCMVGRQLELYEETRRLAEALCGQKPLEFQFNRAEASCCGAASHYPLVAPEASRRCATDILDQMMREGGAKILCGSATCKSAFRSARGEDAALDLLELACQAYGV